MDNNVAEIELPKEALAAFYKQALQLELEKLIIENSDGDIEPDSENEELNDPFNPEEISIDSKKVPMETCLRRLTQGTIKLNPDFQRNEVWTIEKKSQLIESLMLNIPLPMFYVSADERSNYTVIDGLQRLSTIRSFILGDDYFQTREESKKGNGFKLQNLEFWKIYQDKSFNELPVNIKNRILETEFTFTIINPGTPEEIRRNIFKRVNTGGLPLSSQEIRNALYSGETTKLLNELAQYPEFKQATGESIKSLRMEDKELILRFIAFLVRDYTSYKKTISIDTFLSDTMIIVNNMPTFNNREFKRLTEQDKEGKEQRVNIQDIIVTDRNLIKTYFKKAMTRSYQLFNEHTFRKSYGNNRKSQLNKSLFEMWGVLLSQLTDIEFAQLVNQREQLMLDYQQFINNNDFQLAISKDSMKHASVKYRFDTIKELINKNIH